MLCVLSTDIDCNNCSLALVVLSSRYMRKRELDTLCKQRHDRVRSQVAIQATNDRSRGRSTTKNAQMREWIGSTKMISAIARPEATRYGRLPMPFGHRRIQKRLVRNVRASEDAESRRDDAGVRHEREPPEGPERRGLVAAVASVAFVIVRISTIDATQAATTLIPRSYGSGPNSKSS